MDKPPSSRRRLSWPKVLVAIGLAILVLNPLSLFFEAVALGLILKATVPACSTREFTSGEHSGFRIGMTRDEALRRMDAEVLPRWPVFVVDDRPGDQSDLQDIRTPADLRAVRGPDQTWTILKGPTCIVMDVHSVSLAFRDYRLTRIRDEPGMTPP